MSPKEEPFLPSAVYLIDRASDLVEEWKSQFADCPSVRAAAGDYFQSPADAMVSPANSFGIMDGGLDLAIRNEVGVEVERKVQEVIVDKYHGEMPVGCAEIVETNHSRWKYLICAPTMRVPTSVPFTINTYLAFRAVLVAAKNFNRQRGTREIDSLICPGLGTGVGGVSATKCARQMRAAYQTLRTPARIPSFQGIHAFHKALHEL